MRLKSRYDPCTVLPHLGKFVLSIKASRLTIHVQKQKKESDSHTRNNGGYTGIFSNNNYYTHHTDIANSYIHVGTLGPGVLG